MSCLTLNNSRIKSDTGLNQTHKRMSTPALSTYFELSTKSYSFTNCLFCESNSNYLLTSSDNVYNKIITFIKTKLEVENLKALKKIMSAVAPNFFTDKFKSDERELGSGASGSVVLITPNDRTLPQVAIKKFSPIQDFESEADYFNRHAYEIYLACMLEHENIVHAHQAVYQDRKFHLLMDYCPYEFFDMVCSGKLNSTEIEDYFFQLVNGVRFLHKNHVVHRDLKLENLMVDTQGNLKIVDFGFATVIPTSGANGMVSKGLWGSDPYIAPEMFSSEEYDATKADIWSIAIIYVTLVTGRFAWDVAKDCDHYYAKYLVDPNSVGKLIPNSKAAPLILKMLHPDPTQRASMDDMWQDPWFNSVIAKHYERRLNSTNSTLRSKLTTHFST